MLDLLEAVFSDRRTIIIVDDVGMSATLAMVLMGC